VDFVADLDLNLFCDPRFLSSDVFIGCFFRCSLILSLLFFFEKIEVGLRDLYTVSVCPTPHIKF
jgi:hypothetical protein